ncbi:DNA internalization-related competence protein ComEC/Rec2 [Sporolituus thermophilus]|uniref:Competence protein ComEC n=1 Tax=Sporolituus thermophilus DSM 23256 TaxID=1123285 RepID=A0A1G7NM21_9FIRM|nr:DNA internalization-related competence protein ComEC/Rec2 [Sporolituus thermophilus]SDF75022.1 competence protein ComEC [Sporolituus thermophilus DSM 23256]
MRNLTLFITAAFAAGIWAADLANWPWPVLAISFIAFLLAAAWQASRSPARAAWLLAGLFFVAGIVRFLHADMLPANDISRYAGNSVVLSGMVAEPPRVTPVGDDQVKVRYRLETESVQTEQDCKTVRGGIIVTVRQPANQKVAGYGDKITVSGIIAAPRGYQNPGAADWAAALKRQGITAILLSPGKVVVTPAPALSWHGRLHAWRQALKGQIAAALPPGDAAILTGLVFGGYEGIKKEVIADFAATGIIHILSVSGTHIALAAGVALWLGRVLRLRPRFSAALAAVTVLFYMMLAGLVPPVVRSGLMGLTALAALAAGREQDAPTALSLSALAMLAVQPALLYDISFQLSFAATAGLVFLYRKTLTVLTSFLPGVLAGPFAVTLAAQLGVLPFLAWYFNTLSLSAFLANLIIVPLVEGVVILGLAACLVSLFTGWGAKVLLALCGLAIGAVVQLAAFLAAMPGGVVYLPPFTIWAGLIYYFFIAWVYGYRFGILPSLPAVVRQWPQAVAVAGLVAAVCLAVALWYPRPVRVHFIDVGQGDATLITTPHRRAILVDTGGKSGDVDGFDVGEQVVLPYLRHHGIRALDYLILTHGHSDHAGGAAAIAASLPVRTALVAQEERISPAMQAFLRGKKAAVAVPAFTGQNIIIDGVSLTVVHAPVGGAARNEASVVVRVDYGRHSFLLTGDLEKAQETVLVASGLAPCSVLKVGHHGSKTSTSPEFLAALSPQYAVISVGYQNRFGHPHPETLARLDSQGVKVYRTDRDGAVLFTTDGKTLTVSAYASNGPAAGPNRGGQR